MAKGLNVSQQEQAVNVSALLDNVACFANDYTTLFCAKHLMYNPASYPVIVDMAIHNCDMRHQDNEMMVLD